MQLRDIAWASLRRRPGRGLFTASVVALASATVVTLILLSRLMQAEISDELDRFGANIIITPKSQSLDLAYGGIAIAGLTVDAQQLRSEDAAAVLTIPNRKNVNAVAPRLIGATELNGHRVVLIGVVHSDEARVKGWWQVDGQRPRTADHVLIGADAARALAVGVGDRVHLAGAPRTVSGLLRATGTIDDAAVIADLGVVQAALGKPAEVNMIEVSALCSGCPIEHMVDQIATALPHARVAPIRQAVAARERAVREFTRFAYALSVVVLVVGMLVVSATMLGSVVQRTQEIGILRAVGYRRTQVGRVILMETVLVTALGGVSGWLLGVTAARVLTTSVSQSAAGPPPADPLLGVVALTGAIALGILAGGYPAVRAARMEPSQALRHL